MDSTSDIRIDISTDSVVVHSIEQEEDPTVAEWAKQPNKPSYTPEEVGAMPSDTYIPTKVSDLENDEGYLTEYQETDPTVPDWAKEVSKPSYTPEEVGALPDDTFIPSKLSDLEEDAEHLTVSTAEKTLWNNAVGFSGDYNDLTNKPTKLSDFNNDEGFITGYTETDPTVPSWAKATNKPEYSLSEINGLYAALSSKASIEYVDELIDEVKEMGIDYLRKDEISKVTEADVELMWKGEYYE